MAKKIKTKIKVKKIDTNFCITWAKSKKIKSTAKELEERYLKIHSEISSDKPDWDIESVSESSRQKLHSELKAEMKSSAAGWKIKLDFGDVPNDYEGNHYQRNLEYFRKDPVKAVRGGFVRKKTDITGRKVTVVPLDERELNSSGKKNYRKGKPLKEHGYIMTIGGLAMPSVKFESDDWDALLPCTITVSGNACDPNHEKYILKDVQLGEWYDSKLINKTPGDVSDMYTLNTASQTKLVLADGIDIEPEDLSSYYDAFYAEFNKIEEYHNEFANFAKNKDKTENENKTTSNRICMTKAIVIDIVPPEEEDGNTRILLDRILKKGEVVDFDDEADSLTCWYGITKKVPFGKSSLIYAFGKTTQERQKDLATELYTDEWRSVSMSLKGFSIIKLVEPENIEDEEAGDYEEDVEVDEDEVVLDESETPDIENVEDDEEESEEEEEEEEEKLENPKCPICNIDTEEIAENMFACKNHHEFDRGTTKKELVQTYKELNEEFKKANKPKPKKKSKKKSSKRKSNPSKKKSSKKVDSKQDEEYSEEPDEESDETNNQKTNIKDGDW